MFCKLIELNEVIAGDDSDYVMSSSPKVQEITEICEVFVRTGQCDKSDCKRHHFRVPYVWTIDIKDSGLVMLPDDVSLAVESWFCNPHNSVFTNSVSMKIPPARTTCLIVAWIDFESMNALCRCTSDVSGLVSFEGIANVRRLSTPSYITDISLLQCNTSFLTHWRWYYFDDNIYTLFGQNPAVPHQCVLEAKFGRQPLYRLSYNEEEFIFDFQPHKFSVTKVSNNICFSMKRRPIFISGGIPFQGPNPPIRKSPFTDLIPECWSPVDPDQEYELVPISPTSWEYDLISSAFHESVPKSTRKIVDIFRIQHPFLWQKYTCKKQHMELRLGSALNEKQLFHGTRKDEIVKGILHQNFDVRVNGTSNDVAYGRGVYFALNSALSDKYASEPYSQKCWMFVTRVLVGNSAPGRRGYLRPPPVDPAKPYGQLHDSCVNDVNRPTIFVIFDNDQCYPEYVIKYATK